MNADRNRTAKDKTTKRQFLLEFSFFTFRDDTQDTSCEDREMEEIRKAILVSEIFICAIYHGWDVIIQLIKRLAELPELDSRQTLLFPHTSNFSKIVSECYYIKPLIQRNWPLDMLVLRRKHR